MRTQSFTMLDKEDKYEQLSAELSGLLDEEEDPVAVLANAAALIHERMDFFWTGFYLVRSKAGGGAELLLGPFQGPVACVHIGYGKGVCGAAWARGETLVVPDVEGFPGHIACSSRSRSEIVVPMFHPETAAVLGVLDIDSEQKGTFDATDAAALEKICRFLADKCK